MARKDKSNASDPPLPYPRNSSPRNWPPGIKSRIISSATLTLSTARQNRRMNGIMAGGEPPQKSKPECSIFVEASMRKVLLVAFLLSAFSFGTSAKDQPYARETQVLVKTYTSWTTSSGGFSSFTNCSWGSNNLYCGQNVYGPRVFYHVAEVVSGMRWTFEIGCTAKWRWSHCSPVLPSQNFYTIQIKGTDMVFKDLIEGADYNKKREMTFHILQAIPHN